MIEMLKGIWPILLLFLALTALVIWDWLKEED